jgi:hypothetical protein
MSNLSEFAKATQDSFYISDEERQSILATLESDKTKEAFATKLVKDAQNLFNIPDGEVSRVARLLVDTSTRRGAENVIHSFGYKNKDTQFIGTGYSLIMDRVFAENEPLAECHFIVIPAEWSRELWHHERDLTDEGYVYSRWVYAQLPAVFIRMDCDGPLACVLVSEDIYGTFYWGNKVVNLYRGELEVGTDSDSSEVYKHLEAYERVDA